MRIKNEERLYEPIRKYISTELRYYTGGEIKYIGGRKAGKSRYYTKTGVRELQADVVGVKFTGNSVYSDIEICIVEAKLGDKVTRQHINQAFGYTTMAHSVYLASTAELDPDSHSVLRALGLGYLQILSLSETILRETPGQHKPVEKEMMRLLDKLWIGKCTLCQCYLFLYEENREKSYRAMHRPFLLNEDSTIPSFDSDSKPSMITRYLCHGCLKDLKKWRM